MRRLFVILLVAFSLASLAGAEPARPEPSTNVEMPFLIVPMTHEGELLGYAYISSKLVCTSPNARTAVQEKLAFVQDAFVREVNRLPVSEANDPRQVDRDLLNARLTAAARRIVGDAAVVRMIFLEIKFSPLHPSDSATATTPDQAAPAAAANGQPAAAPGATLQPASGPAH